MKYCSLCNNPYDDGIENCTLYHCVSCGSTRLHTDKSVQVNPIAIILVTGLLGIIFWALIFDKMDEITFVITMFGIFMGWFIVGSYQSKTTYLCLECFAKGFAPIVKAPLQESKVDKKNLNISHIDSEEIAKMIGSNFKFKKFDFRVLLLVLSVIIGFFALVFGDIIKKTVDSGLNGS